MSGQHSLKRDPLRSAIAGFSAAIVAALLASSSVAPLVSTARADPAPPGWEASKLELVGFSGLNGRPGAFKLAIRHVADHWYLYMGHSFDHGWSILDVTDPKDPKYVKFIPGPEGVITSQVTLHDNIMITALDGRSKTEPALLIWDISDPINPKQIGQWKGGEGGSHRNSYPGGKYAYLPTYMPGYKGHVMVILDISDPAHPVVAGQWEQPGQKDGEPVPELAPGFHGPANISPDGKMATMGFTPDVVNLDITDAAHPKLIGRLTMTPPFNYRGAQSLHTVLPMWDRKLLYVSSEARDPGCDSDELNFAALVDNKDPTKPRLISIFPTPRPPKDVPYKDFCDKGGRFGPHNVPMELHNLDVHRQGNMMYIAYFNAGLRAFDITDPHLPTETAWFIPPERPDGPKHAGAHESPINWSEDVTEDTRGYIYFDDDKWGIWIVRDPNQNAVDGK